MKLNDVLCLFHSPYSSWGLRYRASKLSDSDYKEFLKLLARTIELKIISEADGVILVELARSKLGAAVDSLEQIVDTDMKRRNLL